MNILSPSRPSRLLFWSFVVLAIVMVIAVALALRGFNREMGQVSESPKSTTGNETPTSQGDARMTPEELEAMMTMTRRSLGGFVSEVIAKESTSEKWITLLVTLPEAAPVDMPTSKSKQSTSVQTKEYAYRFYLGENTPGGNDIRGGEQVILSFFGDPSEKDYVGAEKVEIQVK